MVVGGIVKAFKLISLASCTLLLIACGASNTNGLFTFNGSKATVPGPAFAVLTPSASTIVPGIENLTGTCDAGSTITASGEIEGTALSAACTAGTFSIPFRLTGNQGNKTITLKGTLPNGGITTKTHVLGMPEPSMRGLNLYTPCGNYAGQYYWMSTYDPTGQNKLKIAWDMDYYKARGLKLLRLNYTWEVIQPVLGQALTPWTMECTHYVLDQAAARGMKVIIDLHNYGRYAVNNNGGSGWGGSDEKIIGQPGVPRTAIAEIWTRLATEFNAHPALFAYDLMNEPHDMGDDTLWPDLAQRATTAIRAVDTVTPIMVSGDNWSSGDGWRMGPNENLNIIDPSNKIIYQAHIYFDAYGSGQYNQTYDTYGGTPNIGVDRARPFVEWLQAHNFKGFVGEFGVPEANNPAQPGGDVRWYATLDNFLHYLTANGVAATVWAGGYMWIEYGQPNSWYNISPLDAPSMPANPVDRGQMATLKKYPSHY